MNFDPVKFCAKSICLPFDDVLAFVRKPAMLDIVGRSSSDSLDVLLPSIRGFGD